ncbi:MAG: hypothetical protein AAGI01_13130, partial [Myxococcota bacterium]
MREHRVTRALSHLSLAALFVFAGCNGLGVHPKNPLPTPPESNPSTPRPEGLPAYTSAHTMLRTAPMGGEDLVHVEQGGRLVASDPSSSAVYVVDAREGRLEHVLEFDDASEPGRLEASSTHTWVVLQGAGQVARIALDSGRVSMNSVCDAPRGLELDTLRGILWVACQSGELVSVQPDTLEILESWRIEPDLRDVLATPDAVFVTRFRKAQLLIIDPATGAIIDRATPDARVSSGRLTNLWRMTRASSGALLVSYQHAARRPIALDDGSGPSYALVPGPTVSATPRERTCEQRASSAWSAHIRLTKATSQVVSDHRCAADAALVVDIDEDHCDAEGAALLTRGAPDLMNRTGRRRALDAAACTENPEAYWVDAHHAALASTTRRGRATYLLARGDGALYVRSFPVSVGSGERAVVGAPRDILLSSAAHTHPGFDLFHTTTTASIACASCHPAGGDDGRVWSSVHDGAIVERRTQNLRGGVRGRLHWDGAHEDMSALLSDVFASRMGGFETTAEDARAVNDWLDSLSPDAG